MDHDVVLWPERIVINIIIVKPRESSFFSKNLGRNYVKSFDLVYFTTRVSDVSDTSATQVQHERHECTKSEKRATRAQHECDTKDTSTTRRENFDFDNETRENMFLHPYISYMGNERLQGEEQFHSKNHLL